MSTPTAITPAMSEARTPLARTVWTMRSCWKKTTRTNSVRTLSEAGKSTAGIGARTPMVTATMAVPIAVEMTTEAAFIGRFFSRGAVALLILSARLSVESSMPRRGATNLYALRAIQSETSTLAAATPQAT